MYDAASIEDLDYRTSRKQFIILLILSALWVGFDGIPMVPVGLFFAWREAATQYDTTYWRSLRSGGWRVFLPCLAVAIVSWVAGGVVATFGIDPTTGAGGFEVAFRWLF